MIWRSRLFAPLMLWPPLVLSRPRRKSKKILHIGLHKTATSSFQTTLRRNDFRLARRGIYYPLIGANPRQHGLARRWASSMSERAEPPGGAYATWKRLNRRFSGAGKTLVISTEVLSNAFAEDACDMTELRAFCDGFDEITVLICLRGQIDFAQSVYAEMSKKFKPADPSLLSGELIDLGMIGGLEADYRLLLDRIETGFSPDEILLLSYETCARSEHGVVGALLEAIGASAKGLRIGARVNVSEPHVAIWAANAVWPSEQRPPEIVVSAAARAFREVYGTRKSSSIFTRSEAERLKAHFDPINAEITKRVADHQPCFGIPPLQISSETVYRDDLSQEFWDRFAFFRETALVKI